MLLSKANYNLLENIGVVLADDICTMANSNTKCSINFVKNNYLSMNYIGFFKNNPTITALMNLSYTDKYLIHNKVHITPLQLLHLIEQLIGKVVLHKHAQNTHILKQQSLL